MKTHLILKVCGWIELVAGDVIAIVDFAESDHTFAAFRHAARDSLLLVGLGVLFLGLAYQQEHAAKQQTTTKP